jgi:hypothetical protein
MVLSARSAGKQRAKIPHSVPEQSGANEIDNYADTICAGPNWKLLELSGEYCSVSPFSADYQPKANVPIAKCATIYTRPSSGDSVVLVADQVLWFGNELHCSLIDSHQIRSHGYSVCDNPWDPHRPLGIDLDGIFIPLLASGPNLLSQRSQRIGKWILSLSSKSRLQFGTQQICTSLDHFQLRNALSTVYQQLRAMLYGRNRRCIYLLSHLPSTADAYQPSSAREIISIAKTYSMRYDAHLVNKVRKHKPEASLEKFHQKVRKCKVTVRR